jgi:hypothetical protein
MEARILTDLSRVTFDRVDLVKQAVGQPVLRGDDRLWILGQDLAVSIFYELVEGFTAGHLVTVPRGFVTDGASVPRLAQLITGWRPWDEPQRWAAIVHDWLYCQNGREYEGPGALLQPMQLVAKPWADAAFAAVLRAAGAGRLRASTMFWAVRLFGGHAYQLDQESGPTIRV